MRIVLAVVLAAAISLAAVAAWAEEVQGKVQTVNAAERMIVLEDGTQIWVQLNAHAIDLQENAEVFEGFVFDVTEPATEVSFP